MNQRNYRLITGGSVMTNLNLQAETTRAEAMRGCATGGEGQRRSLCLLFITLLDERSNFLPHFHQDNCTETDLETEIPLDGILLLLRCCAAATAAALVLLRYATKSAILPNNALSCRSPDMQAGSTAELLHQPQPSTCGRGRRRRRREQRERERRSRTQWRAHQSLRRQQQQRLWTQQPVCLHACGGGRGHH